MNINGVFYYKTTNNLGIAKLDINLNPGEYILTAYYDNLEMGNKIKVLSRISGRIFLQLMEIQLMFRLIL